MANLKDLRVRISSVKSTRKITSAMKMVAASRLRKAHEATIKSEVYALAMKKCLKGLVKRVVERQEELFEESKQIISPSGLLIGHKQESNHLIIALTSDKGLCGAFNMNVCKRVAGIVLELEKQGKNPKIFCVGKKGTELLRKDFGDIVVESITGLGSKKGIAYSEAEEVAYKAISLFEQGKIDSCTVVYNHFKSAISQEVQIEKLFPLDNFLERNPWSGISESELLFAEKEAKEESSDEPTEDDWDLSDITKSESENKENQIVEATASRYQSKGEDSHTRSASGSWGIIGSNVKKKERGKVSIPASVAGLKLPQEDLEALESKYPPYVYDYEPSDKGLLDMVIPRYVVTAMFKCMTESLASENGARMTSMDNATRNAGDMIDSLTLSYNRTRQGLITTELVEIISGAESV
jgi:ATP synthase F1 gamma subunit